MKKMLLLCSALLVQPALFSCVHASDNDLERALEESRLEAEEREMEQILEQSRREAEEESLKKLKEQEDQELQEAINQSLKDEQPWQIYHPSQHSSQVYKGESNKAFDSELRKQFKHDDMTGAGDELREKLKKQRHWEEE